LDRRLLCPHSKPCPPLLYSDTQGARTTRRLWRERRTRALPANVAQRAYDKLVQLDVAQTLDDLRVPPGNRLEKLSGDRAGQHSNAHEVEVTDYH
jgi:plasmid maintenance system killer protein